MQLPMRRHSPCIRSAAICGARGVGGRWPSTNGSWLDESLSHAPQARWLREHVPQTRGHFRFDSLEAVRQGVRAGLGVGVLPRFVGDADKELERLTPTQTAGEFGIWVLTHPDLRRSARIRVFVNEIGTLIAARERELLGELS